VTRKSNSTSTHTAGKLNGNGAVLTGTGGLESYDPSTYVVPARDHQGHSVRIWCNVQPSVDHELNVIMASHNWPFKVKGDLFRWAVWEGVKRLEKMRPVPGSMIVVAEAIIESCRASEHWLAFKTSVDKTEATVRSLMDSGNETEALKLLSSLRTQVMKLEEASWRDQWMLEFEKRFAHIWTRAKANAVSLSTASK
jgi:hypothetical protein